MVKSGELMSNQLYLFLLGMIGIMISRTILPVIDQTDVPVTGNNASGIGDISQSFFFSPKEPTSNGLILGQPVFVAFIFLLS